MATVRVVSRFSLSRRLAAIVTVLLLSPLAVFAADSVQEEVRTLRSQVDALLERRQDDFRVLEETIRQYVDKSSEVVALRRELERLRKDIVHYKTESTKENNQKNDHLTVQWLSTSVTELRAEISEMAGALNVSVDLQARQELTTGLDLLRGDVASFRRDLEELRAEQQQTVVTLGQLKQDVDASMRNSQGALGLLTEAKVEVASAKDEIRGLHKSVRRLRHEVKFMKMIQQEPEETETPSDHHENMINTPKESKHVRHHRLIRQKNDDEIEKADIALEKRQARLDGLIVTVEDQVASLSKAADIATRVEKLEDANRSADKKMFNVSKHVAELDRLRLSLLQLLESVETLETKVETNLPSLQREISKMEFTMAQTSSTVGLLKEDQENQQNSVKALSRSVENLQEKLEIVKSKITTAEERNLILNATNCTSKVKLLNSSDQNHESLRVVNNSFLPGLINSMRRMQTEYHDLVRHLPYDCGAIRGPNGVYPIAPGEGAPLLAFCNKGWTIFQRRVDGSEDFNRKWSDYAQGFGTAADEFWLGNEALHRLTADNCSSLRIDLTDIYGKVSYAEYDYFHISTALDGYRISVGGYSGNASDALDYQNHMEFSAVDSDRDISNSHCAANYEGGWWFSHCQHANLNGRYNLGLTWFDGARNEWIAVALSEMKVRRRPSCSNDT